MTEDDLRILPMGDRALLMETTDIDAVLALEADLARRRSTASEQGSAVWAQIQDVVPAARTVLVVTRPGTDLGVLAQQLRTLSRPGDAAGRAEIEEVEIPVHYDGPDLDDVARLTGLSAREVVEAHTATPWAVGFGGFAPGFAYLVDGDPRLEVARRESPRTTVPAGSVGLAGEFSGVYPRESPGGWQLIGRTDATLWDVDRDPPALLHPGVTVRFVEVR